LSDLFEQAVSRYGLSFEISEATLPLDEWKLEDEVQ
jgi:hypothetical protein